MSDRKKPRIRYSSEFKAEAVAKHLKSSVKQVSRDLGVSTHSLRDWVRGAGREGCPRQLSRASRIWSVKTNGSKKRWAIV